MESQNKRAEINERRRRLLKFLVFGGVGFVLYRIFGKSVSALATATLSRSDTKKKILGKQIDMVENDNEIVFKDTQTGEEIFILEKN
jgi:hypothetical protein